MTDPVAPAPAKHVAAHLAATQTVYPWRASLRTGGAILVAFLGAAAAASPLIGPFVDRYLPGAGAGVIGFGVFCAGLATLIARLANTAAVSGFLTTIHLGPVPKTKR